MYKHVQTIHLSICLLIIIKICSGQVMPDMFPDKILDDRDICWRDTYRRGPGLPLSSCLNHFEKAGALCYPKCADEYLPFGGKCKSREYKRSYRRPSRTLDCPFGLERAAGMCYVKCTKLYRGIGSICWQRCPAAYPHPCGAACGKDRKACATAIVKMITAVFELVGNIVSTVFTGGSATAAKMAVKVAVSSAVKQGTKNAIKTSAKKVAQTAVKKVMKKTKDIIKKGKDNVKKVKSKIKKKNPKKKKKTSKNKKTSKSNKKKQKKKSKKDKCKDICAKVKRLNNINKKLEEFIAKCQKLLEQEAPQHLEEYSKVKDEMQSQLDKAEESREQINNAMNKMSKVCKCQTKDESFLLLNAYKRRKKRQARKKGSKRKKKGSLQKEKGGKDNEVTGLKQVKGLVKVDKIMNELENQLDYGMSMINDPKINAEVKKLQFQSIGIIAQEIAKKDGKEKAIKEIKKLSGNKLKTQVVEQIINDGPKFDASDMDPTGILNVVKSFSKPRCNQKIFWKGKEPKKEKGDVRREKKRKKRLEKDKKLIQKANKNRKKCEKKKTKRSVKSKGKMIKRYNKKQNKQKEKLIRKQKKREKKLANIELKILLRKRRKVVKQAKKKKKKNAKKKKKKTKKKKKKAKKKKKKAKKKKKKAQENKCGKCDKKKSLKSQSRCRNKYKCKEEELPNDD